MQTTDWETEQFNIFAGVQQEHTLAHFLFIIVLYYTLSQAMADGKINWVNFVPRRSCRHSKDVLADLDFADNIPLLSYDIKKPKNSSSE